MVSCRSVDLRRRTKLKVSSRESFYDLHRSTALGAAIQGAGIVCGRDGGWCAARAAESKAEES